MYRLTGYKSVIRLSDMASIPEDDSNKDYVQYLEWVSQGGIPEDVPPPSHTELNQNILAKIDNLERQYLMPRITREATILQLETWALSQGYPLDQFRLANKGYRGLKELDETIQQLRSQLIP